jgi:hypothetical protein
MPEEAVRRLVLVEKTRPKCLTEQPRRGDPKTANPSMAPRSKWLAVGASTICPNQPAHNPDRARYTGTSSGHSGGI